MTTPKLGFVELSNSAGNQTYVNNALNRLDQLVMPRVADRDLTTPPGSPTNGAAYIPAATATGAWAGQENKIAYWLSAANAWTFVTPSAGWQVWVTDEDKFYQYNGSSWVARPAGAGGYAPVSTDSNTSISLTTTHAGVYLRTTADSAVTVDVPPQSSETWADDTEIHIEQGGAGAVSFTPGSGVTINKLSTYNAKIAGQYGVATLKRTASNTWTLFGSLELAS